MSIALLVFFLAILVGAPIAFSLGFAGASYILFSDKATLEVLPTVMFGGMDSFPLLAIPFFVMAGDLMSRSGALERMIDFARALVGPVRGGLAHVTVVASMLFGSVTGVSLADAAAIGRTLVPAMVSDGYKPGFAAALTASASVMGAVIPPSVGMLIIAYIYGGHLSIGKLFLSGVTPGILIGVVEMLIVAAMARPRNFPKSENPRTLLGIVKTFRRAALGLGVPVIVIGGIKAGYFTPTEAGAIAVAYALVVGVLLRQLGTHDIAASLLACAKTSGLIFIVLAVAKLFAWLLVINLIPQQLGEAMQPYMHSPQMFLIVVMLIFVILGFVLEGVAVMIMIIPVVAPMAALFGVEPHHLALIILMSSQVALLTPPVCLGLFIVCPFAGCTIAEASREVIPFVVAIMGLTLLIIFVPDVAMWLPRLAGY
jgi:tripartite ATP-independent transporter DctM subunit